jgi:hypothetical protein
MIRSARHRMLGLVAAVVLLVPLRAAAAEFKTPTLLSPGTIEYLAPRQMPHVSVTPIENPMPLSGGLQLSNASALVMKFTTFRSVMRARSAPYSPASAFLAPTDMFLKAGLRFRF